MKSFCLFVFSVGLFFLSCRFEVDNSNKSGNSQTVETYGGTVKKESEYFKDGKKSSDWLIISYMAADNSLDSYVFQDLNEIEAGLSRIRNSDGSPKDGCDSVRCVALWDGHFYHSATHVYDVGNDEKKNSLGDRTIDILEIPFLKNSNYELDMSNYRILEKFLLWVREHYTATHVVFQLETHGGGPGSDSMYLGNLTRAVCTDETDAKGKNMSTREFVQAFKNAGYGSSEKIDMLFLDVCFGAGFEDIYEYRNIAKYLVASPETTPANGNDYEAILKTFEGRKNSIDPVQFGNEISRIFARTYCTYTSKDCVHPTISFIDLSKAEQCADAIDSMAAQIMASSTPDVYQCYFSNVWYYSGTYNYLYDAGKFADKVIEKSDDGETKALASNVLSALDDMIIWSWRRKNDEENILINNAYVDGFHTAENSPYGVTLCGRSSSVLSEVIQPWYRTELEFGRRDGGWADMIMKCFSK